MRKLLILAGFAITGLVSCKKDYTCTCVSNNVETSVTMTETKADARAECDESDGEFEGYVRECELR